MNQNQGFQQQNGLMNQNQGFQQQNGLMNQNQGFQQQNGGNLRRANGASLGLQ
jgi:hypothetical protein